MLVTPEPPGITRMKVLAGAPGMPCAEPLDGRDDLFQGDESLRVGGAAVEHCLQIFEASSIPLTHMDLEGKELRAWFTIADVPDWGDVRRRLDAVLGSEVEFGEEGAVTMVGHGIGGNPGVINKARASAVGAGVPLNAVSVSPLRVTLWCERPHVDTLVKALHKTFIEA